MENLKEMTSHATPRWFPTYFSLKKNYMSVFEKYKHFSKTQNEK